MTAKEAISILTEWVDDGTHEFIHEALQLAIKALSQDGDTISRAAAIDAVQHAWAKGLEPTQYIEDLPSVQLEIIRCKDCKHHRHNNVGDSWCGHPKGLDGFKLMPNDFCSAAERRTDEQTV